MGGHNIEANSILYYTLNQAITLASALNEKSQIATWRAAASTIKSTANTLLWNATKGLYHDNETTTLSPQDGNVWAVLSNLTDSPQKNLAISAALAERWTPYGAPAPEALNSISPFISGFELQTHLLAANASRALALMRLEWGFMLDDARMTNSTFVEGYASNGDLHYAPYTNDARVSFAHGWATGPTSTLTFLVAGVKLVGPGGVRWRIEPMLGDLLFVEAGFSTGLGWFEAKTKVREGGKGVDMAFETPEGTSGTVAGDWFGCDGVAVLKGRETRRLDFKEGKVEIENVGGGQYTLSFECCE